MIESDATTLRIKDLNSKNGTFVNGKRISSGEIHVGDSLRLGPLELKIVHGDANGPLVDDESDATPNCHHDVSLASSCHEVRATEKQGAVLKLVVTGMSDKKIAEQLNISVGTVQTHLKILRALFKVHSRTELIAKVHADHQGTPGTHWVRTKDLPSSGEDRRT